MFISENTGLPHQAPGRGIFERMKFVHGVDEKIDAFVVVFSTILSDLPG